MHLFENRNEEKNAWTSPYMTQVVECFDCTISKKGKKKKKLVDERPDITQVVERFPAPV